MPRQTSMKSPSSRRAKSPKRGSQYCGCGKEFCSGCTSCGIGKSYDNPNQVRSPRTGRFIKDKNEYLNTEHSPRNGRFISKRGRRPSEIEYGARIHPQKRSPKTGKFVRSPTIRRRKEHFYGAGAGLALGALGGIAIGTALASQPRYYSSPRRQARSPRRYN